MATDKDIMKKITFILSLFIIIFPIRLMALTNDGMASYYGSEFQGARTASGEIFDSTDFTAAHRSLPFGTHLKVTNLRNQRSVIVRVNDRGPYSHGRVLDLSKGAAKQLGMTASGVAHIRFDVISGEQLQQEKAQQAQLHSKANSLFAKLHKHSRKTAVKKRHVFNASAKHSVKTKSIKMRTNAIKQRKIHKNNELVKHKMINQPKLKKSKLNIRSKSRHH